MDLENFPTRETAKDMLSMISPIYDRSYVGKWIFQVMAASMELARETVEDMKTRHFRKQQPGHSPGGKNVTESQETRARAWKKGGVRLCRSATQNAL